MKTIYQKKKETKYSDSEKKIIKKVGSNSYTLILGADQTAGFAKLD